MRHNAFGEAYCHTEHEVFITLDFTDTRADQVYCPEVHETEGDEKAYGEIVRNDNGDTVCYVEADTAAGVVAVLAKAEIEIN